MVFEQKVVCSKVGIAEFIFSVSVFLSLLQFVMPLPQHHKCCHSTSFSAVLVHLQRLLAAESLCLQRDKEFRSLVLC